MVCFYNLELDEQVLVVFYICSGPILENHYTQSDSKETILSLMSGKLPSGPNLTGTLWFYFAHEF